MRQSQIYKNTFATLTIMLLSLAISTSAYADLTKHAVEGKTKTLEKTFDFSDFEFCQYDDITCTAVETSKVSKIMTCEGRTTDDGGWVYNTTMADQCWSNLELIYDKGKPTQRVIKLPAAPRANSLFNFTGSLVKMAITPTAKAHGGGFSNCIDLSDSTLESLLEGNNTFKEFCIWQEEGNSGYSKSDPAEKRIGSNNVTVNAALGLSGNTGDDMFKIKPNSSGFLELLDTNGENRLKYFERGNDGETRAIMIPSGPHKDLGDFTNFVSKNVIDNKNACYPVKATISCDVSRVDLPVKCGNAALKNFLFKPRNVDSQLCKFGKLSGNVALKGGSRFAYSWRCADHETTVDYRH